VSAVFIGEQTLTRRDVVDEAVAF